MFTIRDAKIEDALFFAENMRDEDKKENEIIKNFTKSTESELESLKKGIEQGECYVGEINNKPVFIFGAVELDDFTTVGWNICTPRVDECKLFVYETAHNFNSYLKSKYGLIINLIHKENKKAWRLAQKLGAEFEPINEDVFLFHIMGGRNV